MLLVPFHLSIECVFLSLVVCGFDQLLRYLPCLPMGQVGHSPRLKGNFSSNDLTSTKKVLQPITKEKTNKGVYLFNIKKDQMAKSELPCTTRISFIR